MILFHDLIFCPPNKLWDDPSCSNKKLETSKLWGGKVDVVLLSGLNFARADALYQGFWTNLTEIADMFTYLPVCTIGTARWMGTLRRRTNFTPHILDVDIILDHREKLPSQKHHLMRSDAFIKTIPLADKCGTSDQRYTSSRPYGMTIPKWLLGNKSPFFGLSYAERAVLAKSV